MRECLRSEAKRRRTRARFAHRKPNGQPQFACAHFLDVRNLGQFFLINTHRATRESELPTWRARTSLGPSCASRLALGHASQNVGCATKANNVTTSSHTRPVKHRSGARVRARFACTQQTYADKHAHIKAHRSRCGVCVVFALLIVRKNKYTHCAPETRRSSPSSFSGTSRSGATDREE